tara:strand:+ start:349 stop:789 length:441 start_codon:yes stop_codon:yes gene_type:complete
MDLQKLQETKQQLLFEKEKQFANLYEITGAIKLLDQQILEMSKSEDNQQSSNKGINPTRRNSTIRVSGATILLIMFQKIANVLSIISFVMVASMSGGAYFGYKYVTSEQFKAKVMNEILANVSGMMPKVLDQGLPKVTGPSMPIIK